MTNPYFSSLMPSLAERSGQAAISQLGFSNIPVRHRLRELFDQPFGTTGAFLADPTFEAVFGWKAADRSMADLENDLLTPELVNVMNQAVDSPFKRERFPYRHQLQAWEILRRQDPQSLVVTSGTGSGKTECFMVPILDHLARLRRDHGRLIGVRALFLYPLNALINNQRNRLRAWTEPFDGDIRFCLYNGNTPERPERRGQVSSEVLDRQSLRNQPPPILVTNSTMLEYMLVRTQDTPILEHSQGKLEWVVLDEAHTYIGSQAAEVSLLLRRMMSAFGVEPDRVRFVATSATIGDPEGPAGAELKRFLADVAGVDIGRVHLVSGERDIPPLPKDGDDISLSLTNLEQIEAGKYEAHKRYSALCAHPTARSIRRLFTQASSGGTVARLSQVCRELYGDRSSYDKKEQMEALRWLDLLSGTCDQVRREAFLPLRAHFFHQTLSGIWACADKDCGKKQRGPLQDKTWPFGAIYLEPRKHCDCGSPVYEVVSCGDCGAVYLVAGERNGYLHHLQPPQLLDEFELDLEENLEDEETQDEELATACHQHKVLIANRSGVNVGPLSIDRGSRRIVERSDETLNLIAQEDDGTDLSCPQCEAKEAPKKWLFRHGRLSAPFLLGNILPTLLEYAPDGDKPLDHPYRGRRLLSFTDSRQGTARLAAKLQQEAERNRVRGLVYHLSLKAAGSVDPQQKEKLDKELKALEQALQTAPNAVLEGLFADKREELAQLEKPQPVAFNDLATALAGQARDIQFMRESYSRHAPDLFANDMGDVTLARMFLVREFGRRPKRANNLETMGLVATCYPALEKIHQVPAQVTDAAGFNLSTWRDFLKICLDFFVRAGGSLNFPREWKNWLGMRFGQTWLVPYSQDEVGKGQRRWPSVRRGKSTSTLVRLLAYVLEVDLESTIGADRVDQILRSAWDALCGAGLLHQEEPGWRLPMEQMAFIPMQGGYACPVTRRFLDTTLNGITPYLPRNASKPTALCEFYPIPTYPTPFGGVADELERIQLAKDWLRSQPEIDKLRDLGLWSIVNDRVIELAPFFKTAEHSAQQHARRLQQYEQAFQAGDINLLSCSTTMEMGIDIGGISLVSMNNVPPHPSSYLQRAGRAGRRRESRSLAMTLCKSNPHDQMVFSDTRWAFDTLLPAPKVSLDSPVIVQRHVQAMLLTTFFRKKLANANQDQLRLNCGTFFLSEQKSLATAFSAWCRSETRCMKDLEKDLRHLLRRTLFDGVALDGLFDRAAGEMDDLAAMWRTEWDNLQREQKQIKVEVGENTPAYRAVGYHLKRLEDEYLLRELANRGFLPAYGFPSHITPFDNYTVDQFKRERRRQDARREDNRSRFREMPSRDLATALREYAPGSVVVLDGLVYRSAGLTLNWHVPADQEDVKEVQNIKFAWWCHKCGNSGATHSLQEAGTCPGCGAGIKPGGQRQFIEPAGFAVDFYETPSNDVDTQQFVPVESPWIALDSEWTSLPNPDLGRFRSTTRGHIFHQSRGIHGTGYALCLECGRAEPMTPDGNKPERFTKPHRKLRRSKDDAPYCPGSDDTWKIKEGITLGHEAWTDACEFQLKCTDGLWLDDEVAAITLAVALRDALAELIGVESTELACATKRVRTEEGEICQSIVLFDRYAAGYASSVPRYLSALFPKAREKLLCPSDCDSVCPRCVLDFDQRFAAEDMDRHRALALLTEQWVTGFRLPDRYAFFGEQSRPVFTPLLESIWSSVSNSTVKELRLYTGGDLDQWDIALSPLRKLAYQLASKGVRVCILVPASAPEQLDETERHLLASLADAPDIAVCAIESPSRCGEGWLLAEAISTEAERWAGDSQGSLVFGADWGQVESLLVSTKAPTASPLDATHIESEILRPATTLMGDRELDIGKELNGKLESFGKRFWDYLTREHQPVQLQLDSTDPIRTIRYQDRYLFSPLSVRLLFEIVEALRTRMDEERWPAPVLEIETLECRPKTDRYGPPQRFLWSDWDDSATRTEVIQTLFGRIGMRPQIQLNTLQKQAHGRLLEIVFASGKCLRIRFDQGVSYWRVPRSADYRSRIFDFTETDAKRQALTLLRADAPVEGSEQKTQLFIKVTNE